MRQRCQAAMRRRLCVRGDEIARLCTWEGLPSGQREGAERPYGDQAFNDKRQTTSVTHRKG